jgi:D-lactate dehydrogenase
MPVREPKGDRWRPSPPAEPAPDRVEESRAAGTPAGLREGLTALLGPGKVLGDVLDLVRYASDAGPYRFVPQAVAVPDSVQDVVRLLAYARRERRNLVFRAAGTSLAGQAQGEDVLVDVRRHFSGVEVEADGARVRLLPGTVLARANAALARHGRVLGPDPASAAAATVGGVLAGNSTGPAAGPDRDSYRTVLSLTAVLASGTVVDTGDPEADTALAADEPEIHQGLLDIKDEIEADPELTAAIRARFALKNTGGYRLDAFLDAETPAQIMRGLMIGSQGTLGFVAEAVYATLPARRAVTAGLLFFPGPAAAAAAVPQFAQAGAETVELLDGRALRACATVPGAPADWADLPEECAALLVEFRAADDTELAAYERAARRVCDDLGLVAPVASAGNAFTRDPEAVARLWRARGALTAIGDPDRAPGTTLVTEDLAVPPGRLAEACEEVAALLERHGATAALSGRGLHGTLQLHLAVDAADPADVERYAALADDLCGIVTERLGGSLRAERGAGRQGAPFVEREWGSKATALMWRIKRLLDPEGVLAPRVLLDQDPRGHLRGLKTVPATGPGFDACTECGLCEPVCPSREPATTPRQRIAVRREQHRQPAGSPVLEELLAGFGPAAVASCAGDSLCAAACPAGIDTGALMREFRRTGHQRGEERTAALLARRWRTVERTARAAATAAAVAGGLAGTVRGLAAHPAAAPPVQPAGGPEAGSGGRLPGVALPGRLPGVPGRAPRMPRTRQRGAAAVYVPTCANRLARPPAGRGWVVEALVALAERAGSPLWIPPDVPGTCCAAPWYGQGYDEGCAVMANRVVEHAWAWSGGGRLPVVVDAPACALGLGRDVAPYLTEANRELHEELTVVDAVSWAADQLLPKLGVAEPLGAVVAHPTCAGAALGADEALLRLAGALAREVAVPLDAGCCGFAPERGVFDGRLSAAACRGEAEEVAERAYDGYVSFGRSCEVALERATGEPYESVLVALERASR